MVVALEVLLHKVGDLLLLVDGCSIFRSCEIIGLDAILDSNLPFLSHINSITKSASTSKPLSNSAPHSQTVVEMLICAFITSWQDYSKGVLRPGKAQVLSSAAMVLTHTSPHPKFPNNKQLNYLFVLCSCYDNSVCPATFCRHALEWDVPWSQPQHFYTEDSFEVIVSMAT